jgi:hypothetical protein
MRLAELQALFSEAMLDEDGFGSASARLESQISSGLKLSAARQIGIYRNSTLAGLQNALSEIFPVCMRLVGEDFFYALTRRYVCHFPSRSPDLGDYGEDFPDYAADFEPLAGLPYFPDVARLEWNWHRVFHAPRSIPFDFQALAGVPEDRQGDLVFALPLASALLQSRYPVHRIWQVNQPEFQGDSRVDLDEGGIRLLIWRDDNDMRVEPVDEPTWHVLNEIQAGHSVVAIYAHLAQHPLAVDMSRMLPDLVRRGWIASFLLAKSVSPP